MPANFTVHGSDNRWWCVLPGRYYFHRSGAFKHNESKSTRERIKSKNKNKKRVGRVSISHDLVLLRVSSVKALQAGSFSYISHDILSPRDIFIAQFLYIFFPSSPSSSCYFFFFLASFHPWYDAACQVIIVFTVVFHRRYAWSM